MTEWYVTSDNVSGGEENYINQAITAIEEHGDTAVNGGVGPANCQNHGNSSESSGQQGVQIVGGRCGGTFADFITGMKNGYYHYDMMHMVGSSEFTGNEYVGSAYMDDPFDGAAWDDSFSGSLTDIFVGKSPRQMNEEYGQYAKMYLADTFDEALKMMLGENTESDEGSGTSLSTYKDMLKDLIKIWDGDVEAYIIEDVMYVHKIPLPEPEEEIDEETGEVTQECVPEIYASEGVNIAGTDISITDVNPNTINTLVVSYMSDVTEELEYYTFVDNLLVERFGEKLLELPATRKETTTTTKETESTTDSSTSDSVTEDTSTTSTDSTDTSTSTDTTDSTDTETTTETTTTTVEVPITDPQEAYDFAVREWNKIKRDNAHTVELKVFGYNDWRVGQWCKFYSPMFSEFVDMYITSVQHSHSANEEWLTSIQLTDYAPSLSEDTEEETTEDEEEEDESTEDTDSTESTDLTTTTTE